MIGRITGKIIERSVTHVVVDVGGVGYEIDIPLSTYAAIAQSDKVSLHTHLIVRDDAHLLYGFQTAAERELFRALIKVNRVGPKLAITIMSGMEGTALAECIEAKDVKALSGLPGVGKKTAEQMIIDLAGRLPDMGQGARVVPLKGDNYSDAESALIELGFKPAEAARALSQVEDPAAEVETLIRQALKALG